MTYQYDADGLRIAKTASGTTTYTLRGIGGKVVSEYEETGGALKHLRDYVYLGDQAIAAVTRVGPSDHVRTSAAASSTLDFQAIRAIDTDNATAWSSTGHSTAAGYEWLAVWWETATTRYVRLVPRTVDGTQTCVPQSVNIYYSANSAWNYVKSVNLPSNISASGYDIDLGTSIVTNGILLTTNSLRADASGMFYFQMAEVYGAAPGLSLHARTIVAASSTRTVGFDPGRAKDGDTSTA